MVRSMTGYGRGESQSGGGRVTAELRAVNNRYLDCTVRLPRAYSFAEEAVKALVQKRVSRGKVEVWFTLGAGEQAGVAVSVNTALAVEYKKALEAVSAAAGVDGGVTLETLARFPDVIAVERQPEDQEAVTGGLLAALSQALDGFDAMRCREGARLEEDVRARALRIGVLTGEVEKRAPGIVADYRAKLTSRLQEVLKSTQVDESRILTEAAIYADKVAVDEETVRLRSHLSQLDQMLTQGGAIGRKLDFLIQEFNREANTIGSKCSDLETTRVVVEIKAEIEKIREQIQNLE